MVIVKDKPIDMPRPFCGTAPTITFGPRTDGKEGRYITVQISGPIESLYQFTEFLQVLDQALESDVIDVVIDTPGGCVFTTQVLLEHMNSCKAHVTSVANGLVASAGTFLWFFSKNKKVNDWATFMFHGTSHVDYGKSVSIQETAKEMVMFTVKTVKAMIAGGVLTAEEAGKIFKQKKDLFLPGNIIRARMLTEIAATESISLRSDELAKEGDYKQVDPGKPGEFEKDLNKDPSGTPDPAANKQIDEKTTDFNPEAIMKAEGVTLTGEGEEKKDPPPSKEGEENKGGEEKKDPPKEGENGEGAGTTAGDKCKKAKKKVKKIVKVKNEDGTETEKEVEEEIEVKVDKDGNEIVEDGKTEETAIPAEETTEKTSDNAFLKWSK